MKSEFKRGVSRRFDSPNEVAYSVDCACGSDDCAVTIEIGYTKADPEWPIPDFSMLFYKKINLYYSKGDWALGSFLSFLPYSHEISEWLKDNWDLPIYIADIISKAYWRVKHAAKILFTGQIEMDADFLITDGEHVENFIAAMNEGLEWAKEARDKE